MPEGGFLSVVYAHGGARLRSGRPSAHSGNCPLTFMPLCYMMAITDAQAPEALSYAKEKAMVIEIDFNSDEALYLQLRNQIILGIATAQFREGDSLPSVRQLADTIGINMHTVNKAYSVLRQEGFVKVDRRRGAVIAIDADKMRTMEELRRELQVILARSSCRNVSREEVHALIDEIYEEYGGLI